MSTTKSIVAYKGFNKDMQCRGFQFEVGKTYIHEGSLKMCESGFHACEAPLDTFGYYTPSESKYASVELKGVSDEKQEDDSKRVAKSISIKAALTIADLVEAQIQYINKCCDPVKAKHSTGNLSASSATGKNSVAMSIGIAGKAKAGKGGAIVLVNHDNEYNIRHIRASKVGENGIKPDTWYVLSDAGEFVEAE